MKNAIGDITLQRLKNETEFCPDSKDNLDCLMEDEQNSTKYFYRCDLYSDGLLHSKTKETRPQKYLLTLLLYCDKMSSVKSNDWDTSLWDNMSESCWLV